MMRLRSICTYRHSYHGVVWFPFCLLVEAKLGGCLRRLDIADYQNTGLWVGNKDMGKKISTLNILQVTDILLPDMTTLETYCITPHGEET